MKTSELTGLALDWAVAKCFFNDCEGWDGTLAGVDAVSDLEGGLYRPSIDWAQGGAIIEEELMTVAPSKQEGYMAWSYTEDNGYWGETLLVAAMRCFVAGCLGDEIDVPEEVK